MMLCRRASEKASRISTVAQQHQLILDVRVGGLSDFLFLGLQGSQNSFIAAEMLIELTKEIIHNGFR